MPEPHAVLSKMAAGVVAVAACCWLVGCADVAASPDDSTSPAAEVEQSDPGATDAGDGDTGDPDDEQRFGVDLETTGQVLSDNLENVSGYEVSGQTLTITFSEGSADFDGMLDCLSGGGLMGADETLILEYPDGAIEC